MTTSTATCSSRRRHLMLMQSWPMAKHLRLVARGENITNALVMAGINGDNSIERGDASVPCGSACSCVDYLAARGEEGPIDVPGVCLRRHRKSSSR